MAMLRQKRVKSPSKSLIAVNDATAFSEKCLHKSSPNSVLKDIKEKEKNKNKRMGTRPPPQPVKIKCHIQSRL